MGSLHISSLIMVWASGNKSDEIFLTALELAHIGRFIKVTDPLILEHQLIELFDYS